MRILKRPASPPLEPDSQWDDPITVTVSVGAWHTDPGCRFITIPSAQQSTTAGEAVLDVASKSGQMPCASCTLTELPAVAIRRARQLDPATAAWVAITCDAYWRADHSRCVSCRTRATLADGYRLPVHQDDYGHVLLATPIDPTSPPHVLPLLGRIHPLPTETGAVTSDLLRVAWLTRTTSTRVGEPQLHFDVSTAVLAPAA